MRINSVQGYNVQPQNNNLINRKQNVSFTALGSAPTYSKKGCGFLMALSLATVIGTISAPFLTYNYLSENEKENGKVVNILASIGSGIAAFGVGSTALFHSAKKFDSSKSI